MVTTKRLGKAVTFILAMTIPGSGKTTIKTQISKFLYDLSFK